MKNSTRIIQYLLGVLFIASALLKINDPLGLAYKMDEYFEAFNLLSLKAFSFPLTIFMNVLEMALGVSLLLNMYTKLLRWVLLGLMIFFTLLTGYAYFSGSLKECGCLGNCFPIPASASFWKDVVLLVLIVWILPKYELFYKPRLYRNLKTLLWWLAIAFAYLIQAFIYIKLPYVDCLNFTEGTHIPSSMRTYLYGNKDSIEMRFYYEKEGEEVSFTAYDFPKDFDSTYQFIRREDIVLPKQEEVQSEGVADFVLTSLLTDEDIAQQVLAQDTVGLILVLNELGEQRLNKILEAQGSHFEERRHKIYFISADSSTMRERLVLHNISLHLGAVMDNVAIKTMSRSPLTYYQLVEGTIVGKRGITYSTKLD